MLLGCLYLLIVGAARRSLDNANPAPPPPFTLPRGEHRIGPEQVSTSSRYRRRRVLVRAAFLAAAERPAAPFVFTAFLAAAERAEAVRREAARRACFESAARDAVLRGSRLRTPDTARETRGRRRGFRLPWPASYAYSALLRVLALALPFRGGRRATPARLALDRPMAMACCGDLAPCSPRRTLRISSCTNSPA